MNRQRAQRIAQNLLVKEDDGSLSAHTLAERLEYYHTTAITLALIDDYKIDSTLAVGKTALNGDPVSDDTPFMAASVSKAVTAVGAMMLVQNGTLDLDRDVNEYLKGYVIPAKEGLSNRVTLRQIFGHLGGLNVHGFGGYKKGESVPTLMQVLNGEPPSKTERVMVVRPQGTQVPLSEDPQGSYSGGGLCIAQKVMCDVTGRPFEELMDELVLTPFGMTNSTFYQADTESFRARYAHKTLPVGYNATRGGARLDRYVPVQNGPQIYCELAAGGLWSTSVDLAKFGVRLQSILRQDDCSTLFKHNLEEMLVQQENSENGIGFYIYPTFDPNVFMFAHTGCNDGFMSMAYFTNDGRGFALMFNSNEGLNLYYEIPRAIAREYGYPIPPEAI